MRPCLKRPLPNATGNAIPRRAFTLVELLVVIGIIATLISILLPALGSVREVAKGTKCLANLQQMGLAFSMYTNENKQYLPPTSGGNQVMNIDGTNQTVAVRWYGGAYTPGSKSPNVTAGTFYGPATPLASYWGTANIGGCPAFYDQETALRPGYGPCSYAYNDYLGKNPAGTSAGYKITKVRNASEKAMVWDSARILPPATKIDRTPWGYPVSGNPNNKQPDPNFHGRHKGKGNVVWADGHASMVDPYCFASYPGTSLDAAVLKREHLGNIDTDGNLKTDEHYLPEY